jgi:polyphosphate kinase
MITKLKENMNFKNTSQNFINRELSWLEFNKRVLALAKSENTPTLEKLKFFEIYISNLDDFFMKRVGGLKNQEESKHDFISVDGRSPTDQLIEIKKMLSKANREVSNLFSKKIIPELRLNGIYLLKWIELKKKEKDYLTEYFKSNIFPILTPLGVDSGHPFPYISNLSKSLGISLIKKNKKGKSNTRLFIRIKIPSNIPAWIQIPTTVKSEYKFINIDDVIINNIHLIFSKMKIEDIILFRITRNSDFEKEDEDNEDLMEHIEDRIKERKFAPVVRLEHLNKNPSWALNYLCQQLEVGHDDIYSVPDNALLTKFGAIYNIDRPDLKFKFWGPSVKKEYFSEKKNIFLSIKNADKLFHHPYDSYSGTVEKFIQTSARDPKVLAIKLTLYRTDADSKIIDALIFAAKNGKQIACVIEIQACFDEQNNIKMAQRLEKVGIYVVYGMIGLKTHSKMALVVRKEKSSLCSYVHIATGNYNSRTSKYYTDFSFFTCNKKITSEVHELFNELTGIHTNKKISELLVAPLNMKKRFLEMINREISHKKASRPAKIIAKMNSLQDKEIIEALYKASQAGVEITLIVRGFCCLRPGIPKLSENIKVISIVGRFLEHSRVYFFQNGKEDHLDGDFFIGSADWMYRNLINRFEVITPIKSTKNKKKLWHVLQVNLDDFSTSWELKNTDKYVLRSTSLSKMKRLKTATHTKLMSEV